MPHVVRTHLETLTPDTRVAVTALMNALEAQGYTVKISESYRDPARQAKLYALSEKLVSEGKAPVTKTRKSWHEVGRAVDFSISPFNLSDILTFLDLARERGFRTVADPDKARAADSAGNRAALGAALWDAHHVEYRAGRTWDEAAAEYAALQKAPELAAQPLGNIVNTALAVTGAVGLYNASKE